MDWWIGGWMVGSPHFTKRCVIFLPHPLHSKTLARRRSSPLFHWKQRESFEFVFRTSGFTSTVRAAQFQAFHWINSQRTRSRKDPGSTKPELRSDRIVGQASSLSERASSSRRREGKSAVMPLLPRRQDTRRDRLEMTPPTGEWTAASKSLRLCTFHLRIG